MKQLTHNLLKLNVTGVEWSEVEKIEIAFAQNIGEAPLKVETYPSVNAFEVTENLVGVVWTEEDTALFEAGRPFYMDTRITLNSSEFQPETQIAKLRMNPTLFEPAEGGE